MLHPGLRLRSGRYRLLSLVRAGATAQVWRALDVKDGTEVAVKAVPADAGGAAAVEHEAEALTRVRHAGAVRVHATFEEAGHGLIVMELAACSLADHVEAHGPLDGTATRGVALALAEVLAVAHAAGVVHRDVKPQNVLVLPDGSVRLADFGIARVHARGHTRTSALLGTLPFMAPEQRRDARDVRPATDVYALAALTAWMRTGSAPGDLFVPGVISALRERLRAAGEPDDALLDLLVAAGAHDPAERTPDGARVAEALRGVGASLEGARVGGGAPGAVSGSEATAGGGLVAGRALDSWGGEGAPPPPRNAAPPGWRMSWGTIGFVATGTVVTAMLGVWVGAQIAGRAALGSQTKADTEALPFCPTRWNPTSLSRTLGPRETVGVTADDLDADGHVDVIFANQLDESLSIYWGDGSARLGTPDTLAVGRVSAAPTVGDIDGDGRRDLLVPDADHSELRPFLQSDGRRFVASIPIQHPDLNTDGPPALLRWDSDGLLDLLVVAEGGLKIRRGLRDGDFEDVQIDISSQVVPYAVVRRRDGPDAVLLGGTDPHTVEADTRAVAVRKTTWPDMRGTPLVWSSRLFISTGSELTELASDGTACAFATTPIPTTLLVDLDADGTPEGLTADTCSGCTSNHIVVGGG